METRSVNASKKLSIEGVEKRAGGVQRGKDVKVGFVLAFECSDQRTCVDGEREGRRGEVEGVERWWRWENPWTEVSKVWDWPEQR